MRAFSKSTMSFADLVFEYARRNLNSPYDLWTYLYHEADNYPHDEKLQCLFTYLDQIFLAEREYRFDDLKKQGTEDYLSIDNASDDSTIINALDDIEQNINTLMLGV